METFSTYGGANYSRKSSEHGNVPQLCELELCRLPDWHLYSYRERFSSSSFADSESEEEMSKRAACRELMGPPPTPPKIRRGGAYRGSRHGHSNQPMGPPACPGFRRTAFSHSHSSSSDDDVFLEPLPVNPRGPSPFMRHPPPFPDNMNNLNPMAGPSHHHKHHQQQRHHPPAHCGMDRRHSMPEASRRGRDFSQDLGHFRSRDLSSRGRKPPRGHSHPVMPGGAPLLPPRVGESSDETSMHTVMSASDEFEYLYRYGYRDRQGSSQEGRSSSGATSGSDKAGSSPRKAAGRRGAAVLRGRGHTPVKGQLTGTRGTASREAARPRAGSQPSMGRGGHFPTRGSVLKHQPLPSNQPAGALHMQNINKGIHSLATTDVRQPLVDLTLMSLSEKLHRFMLFVRNENSARVNDIQTIENAITGCHLDLKTSYEAEDVGVYQGRHTFSGKLTLSGIFLARAVGQVKKELKHECYKLALQVLRTKEVSDIMKQHDIGIEAIRSKFEECSAAEGDPNVNAAVVNLASAAPIAVAMETVATTDERWQDFILYLKGLNPAMGNTVSRIELALSGSRCGLERVYTDIPILEPVQGKPGFQGSLVIASVLQAQGQGYKKKEAKQKTFDLAYERFTMLELADIMKGVEPQTVEATRKESKALSVQVKEIRTAEHLKKFELFIDRIKDSSVREGPVTLLDLTANQLQLLITCMYKKVDDGECQSLCQLFVGDILISEGEGRHKKEAQADAYSKAYDRLISTPLDTIVADSHRLHKEELQGADVQDVVVKGQMKREESNLPRLRNQFPNVEEALSEAGSDSLVVVEHQDWVHDRKRHAFCILQNSALMNIMVLKWFTEIETGFFTCTVTLQGEEVGRAKSHSRQQARNLAAAAALFKMYEKHPVLRVINMNPPEDWITKAQLEEKLKEMAETEFEEVDAEWREMISRKAASKQEDSETAGDTEEMSEEQKEKWKLERRLRVVALALAKEFQERGDILAELTFAPDLPLSVRRYLPTSVARLGLRSTQCQKDGQIYVVIHFRIRVDKVVAAMKGRGVTQTSRFLLVEDRSELPCYADVSDDIQAAQNQTRQERLASRLVAKPACSQSRESRDAAVGNSLNGSLFEVDDTEDGFVTAQSSMLAESTPKNTPPKKSSPAKAAATTPAEEVYARFAQAMMASGVGQTLVPVKSSTPLGGSTGNNILLHPPPTSNPVTSSTAAPVIKNILISPPTNTSRVSVTLSSPKKNLSLSSSSTSFPQPDFSSTVSPGKSPKRGSSNHSQASSGSSTLSPDSSGQSCRHSGHGGLRVKSPAARQGDLQGTASQAAASQPPLPQTMSSRPARNTAVTSALGQAIKTIYKNSALPACSAAPEPSAWNSAQANFDTVLASRNSVQTKNQISAQTHKSALANENSARTNQNSAVVSAAQKLNTAQSMYPHYGQRSSSSSDGSRKPDPSQGQHGDTNANGRDYHGNICSQAGGAWHDPFWKGVDPSAPHAIQMSPTPSFTNFQAGGGMKGCGVQGLGVQPGGCRTLCDQRNTAIYVENEVPSHHYHGYGRRWNYNKPV